MSGRFAPPVRLQTVVAGQAINEDLRQDTVVVELPPINKFGFTWPTDSPHSLSVPPPLSGDRLATLSSSDGETDLSEEEMSVPARRQHKTEEVDESEFVTPTNYLNADQNPIDQATSLSSIPRLSRAFSMPLPSQLGPLQNPRRVLSSPGDHLPAAPIQLSPEFAHFHELSLELADSVQSVIQTLLQLSPPQVLDPAKEQFSACSLSIPTPSISAMFTSMKNLNYMSANMSTLASDLPQCTIPDDDMASVSVHTDFDVGEMLQSVGDVVSGVAAQVGIDLVLFHGDVGLRHVAVRGDENGISYMLSHVIRQMINAAFRGDTIEVGLFTEPARRSSVDKPSPSSSPTFTDDEPIRCMFRMTHKFYISDSTVEDCLDTATPMSDSRPSPSLNSHILRRLLRHIGASLETDMPSGGFFGRSCDVTVTLERGAPSVVDPIVSLTPEDARILGHPEFKFAHEPTLEQLTQFADSLRGKKVNLHASSKGYFAQHLTSYLTAWGLDVSHVSTEPGVEEAMEHPAITVQAPSPMQADDISQPKPAEPVPPPVSSSHSSPGSDPLSFILIDDDVAVLRDRLSKFRLEQPYPLHIQSRKRPSLAAQHRPRSSPQVARVMAMSSSQMSQPPQVVIVHFTSLSNFKLVKDAIQSWMVPGIGSMARIPEVIVIPKPAGPRRILTALHTAVTKPVVDPFFAPIATSPMSPGVHSMSPFFSVTGPKSPGGRSSGSVRSGTDRSARSPKDFMGDTVTHAPSSPLGAAESMEYFTDPGSKLGTSASSGLVIQSPDGQPAGIFFHPKQRNPGPRPLTTPEMKREMAQEGHPAPLRNRGISFRRLSDADERRGKSIGSPGPRAESRTLMLSPAEGSVAEASDPLLSGSAKGKGRQIVHSTLENGPGSNLAITGLGLLPASPDQTSSPTMRTLPQRKASISDSFTSSPPASPQTRGGSGVVRRGTRKNTADIDRPPGPASTPKKGKATDGDIVPPISVLIVDDNPINQTILSTFMKKKKIKYDVAKNGEEAVKKWQSGVFHLILMDIQMPVMDGITATKEIRRMERTAGTTGFPSPQSEDQQTPSETSTNDSRTAVTPSYRSSVIIVALTASSLQSDRVAALAAGCNDFLTKPVSLHWLNSKIIEWGSIKALQMWADIRPDVVKSISYGQAAQAQNVARRLHVPEGRSTPTAPRSRTPSVATRSVVTDAVAGPSKGDKTVTPNTPFDSPGSSHSSDQAAGPVAPVLTPIGKFGRECLLPEGSPRLSRIPNPVAEIGKGPAVASEGALPDATPTSVVPHADDMGSNAKLRMESNLLPDARGAPSSSPGVSDVPTEEKETSKITKSLGDGMLAQPPPPLDESSPRNPQ